MKKDELIEPGDLLFIREHINGYRLIEFVLNVPLRNGTRASYTYLGFNCVTEDVVVSSWSNATMNGVKIYK